MRGRLHIARVRPGTPLGTALDVLTVIVMDTPGKALEEWRKGLDRATMATTTTTQSDPAGTTKPDRATWGLLPHQIGAHQRFMSTAMGGASSPAT